jgi:hypothetical protein
MYVYGTNYGTNYFNNTTYDEEEEEVCSAIRYDINIMVELYQTRDQLIEEACIMVC